MRRPLYLLALTFFIPAISVLGQTEKRLPGNTGAVGPVKTIRIETATFTKQNGTAVEGSRVLQSTLSFNEDGTKQERELYAPTGQVIQRTFETYEPDGRITESRAIRANGDLISRTVTLYDDHKQRSEVIIYGPNDTVRNHTTFRRTDGKLESESVAYDVRGSIIGQVKTSSDLKSHQIESTSITPTGVIQTQAGFTDKPDVGRDYRSERSNGEFEWTTTKSEGPGAINRVIYNRDGTIKSRERLVHEYDAHRNIIKTVRLSAQGDSGEFEPVDVAYRTFTYYEKSQ